MSAALLSLGRLEECQQLCDDILQQLESGAGGTLTPILLKTLLRRGTVHSSCRRPRQALADYQRAVRLVPEDPDVVHDHNTLAETVRHMNEAERLVQQAGSIMQASTEGMQGQSEEEVNQHVRQEYLKALELLDQAVEIVPVEASTFQADVLRCVCVCVCLSVCLLLFEWMDEGMHMCLPICVSVFVSMESYLSPHSQGSVPL